MKSRSLIAVIAGLALACCCCCSVTRGLGLRRRCYAEIPADNRFPPRTGEEIRHPFPLNGQETTLRVYPLDPDREDVTFRIEDSAGLVEPVEVLISYDTWAGGSISICQLDSDPEPELLLEGAIHEPYWAPGFLDYERGAGRFIYHAERTLPNRIRLGQRIREALEAFAFLIAQPVAWIGGKLVGINYAGAW